jgi:hypothetical protein
MDYTDLDAPLKASAQGSPLLQAERHLKAQAERHRRELVQANMDTIVSADPTQCYFRPGFAIVPSHLKILNGELSKDARALNFPADIRPDWGRALEAFHRWTLYRLNCHHLLGSNGEDNHWPSKAKELQVAIKDARARLYPLLHDGKSYAKYLEESTLLSKEIVSELIDEEKTDGKKRRHAR